MEEFFIEKSISIYNVFFFNLFSFIFMDESKVSAKASKGGYVKSTYYAYGGRVNIEYHDLYLRVADARKYAAKSEVSIAEGACMVWR
ncbi:hypothetical protein [Bacillus methanolicus]|uniref:Uncharacterized protein n=1 Tax=Bacillus methanolicus (strain MGA3 / ATCC 53907) TaxID=796606 RepID=A0A068LWC0_BACMM|nr:hypothetical protein [Bacillus methanolicus]AIE59812.1 hypothetical protein BMMGA3_06945 [Bacillus methanolicus MGA3]